MVHRILCVCFGNTCRSPMMEKLLQKLLGDKDFVVESAGLKQEAAGQSAAEDSARLMCIRGLDLSAHKSRWIGDLDLTDFSYIVTVGEKEATEISDMLPEIDGPNVIVVNHEGGGVPNPWKQGPAAYDDCVALLERELPTIADMIRN